MSNTVRLFEALKQAAALRLPGATISTIDDELRWVVDEWLTSTNLYKKTFSVTMIPGTTDYTVSIPDNESGHLLLDSFYDTRILAKQQTGALPAFPYTNAGDPQLVWLLTDRTIRVYPVPAPETTGTLVVNLALTILPVFEAVPPEVMRPYQGEVLHGLLARMMGIPEKPYTNTKLGAYHLAQFESGKVRCRRELDGGRVKGARFVHFPRFA